MVYDTLIKEQETMYRFCCCTEITCQNSKKAAEADEEVNKIRRRNRKGQERHGK